MAVEIKKEDKKNDINNEQGVIAAIPDEFWAPSAASYTDRS